MTRNEKKYAARYLEAWHRYGNNLPNEEYDKLSRLRQQLGIRLARAQQVERDIIKEGKVSIRRTPPGLPKGEENWSPLRPSSPSGRSGGVFPSGRSGGVVGVVSEIAQYEATIDEILSEVSDVSEKMEAIKRQLITVSGSLIKEGVRLMRRKHYSGKSKTGLIVSASGAALGLAAYVFQSYRRRIIEKKRSEQLDELLLKKREIADVRLKLIEQLNESFKRTIVPRMSELYDKEFNEELDIDDPLRDKKLDSFRSDFVLSVKVKYLSTILDFVIAEMKAWQQGKQTSGMQRPDINGIIDEELLTWPKRLDMASDDGSDWDDMLSDYLREPRKAYPYPIYLMLSDPYMLRSYIGLGIQTATNANEPLVQLEYKEEEKTIHALTPTTHHPSPITRISIPVQHILEQNPYYKDCVRLLEDSHVPTPKGFGWKDGIIMTLYVGTVLGLAYAIWQTTGLVFTLLAAVYCITVPFTVLPVTEHLPYVTEEIKYEKMLADIKRREESIAGKYRSIVINE